MFIILFTKTLLKSKVASVNIILHLFI